MDVLKRIDFNPDPITLVKDLCENKKFDVMFGFIHGSYVYKNEFLKATYSETMYFSNGIYEKSIFDIKRQSPDVDVVIIVADPNLFFKRINDYIFKKNFVSIFNYFLTINVVSVNVFTQDIKTINPTALKRILRFRNILPFGDIKELKKFIKEAISFTSDLDYILQEEYDNRKQYLDLNLKKNVSQFELTESKYASLFRNYVKYILKSEIGGFPKDREKLVFPKPMGLKNKVDSFLNIHKELL